MTSLSILKIVAKLITAIIVVMIIVIVVEITCRFVLIGNDIIHSARRVGSINNGLK